MTAVSGSNLYPPNHILERKNPFVENMFQHLKFTRLFLGPLITILATAMSVACGPTSSETVADATALPFGVGVTGQVEYDDSYPESTMPKNTSTAPKNKDKENRPPGRMADGVTGIANWINSDPLTIEQLRGKVVLVDFWTYTCVNCIRTFPFLREWNTRYADKGLVILGIHTPEFEFEKDYNNVVRATLEHDIVWPVAQDNDFKTWINFSNRFWPAKYLIDKNGVVRYTHFGEGSYAETERKIQELLIETGSDFRDVSLEMPEDPKVDPGFERALRPEVTRELYAGYNRNYAAIRFGQPPYVRQDAYFDGLSAVVNFEIPKDLSPGVIYFHGPWSVEEERSKHFRDTTDYEDYLELNYSAASVNAVLTSHSGEPYKVRLTVEGEYLNESNKGLDVIIGKDGESYILVTEPKLYALLDNPSYVRREVLRMSSNSKDFGIFAFTFGVYEEGP